MGRSHKLSLQLRAVQPTESVSDGNRRRLGFTLIELLVVIGIIVILICAAACRRWGWFVPGAYDAVSE